MRTEWGEPPAYRDTYGSGGGGGLSFPPVTPIVRKLLWINGIAFLLQFLLVRFTPTVGRPVFDLLTLVPGQWWQGFPLVPVWQVLTYGFLHSTGDVGHLLFNLLGLYFFGTMVEGVVGGRRFLVTYLVALVLGGLAQLTLGLVMISQGHPAPSTLGASGGVLCMIVAAAVLMPETRIIFILFPLKLRTLALILVGIDVFSLLMALSSPAGEPGSRVAWLVHLTGAAYGYLAVRRRWIWRDPMQAVAERADSHRASREQEDRERLDALLSRINREGMSTLTRGEKAFLKKMSARKR